MSRLARVAKMHGANNDFVILDERENRIDEAGDLARWICNRHAGIGADGLLLVGRSAVADATMRVMNADGSEAEMCGNGIRCVARYLDEAGAGDALRIETRGGIISTQILERGPTYRVRAGVPKPRILDQRLAIADAMVVDTGNPHLVWFRDDIDTVDLVAVGEAMQRDPGFPAGTNVHLVAVQNEREMRVRHYERGVGLTMACGTGAIACAAAGIARGVVMSPVDVHVPGGTLIIAFDAAGNATMTGPAVHVFDAEIRLP